MNAVVVFAVVGVVYVALAVAVFRHTSARTPAGIVRLLYKARGRPVTIVVNTITPAAWDPSRTSGYASFYTPGVATYTLDGPTTIHVRFQPRIGNVVEHSASIPASLLPDSPQMHRRRVIARVVIALYAAIGIGVFAATAAIAHGSRSTRIQVAALVSLGAVAVAWLITHLVLVQTRRAHRHRPTRARAQHLLAWCAAVIVIAAALGVAWHLGNLDSPQPMSWASSFLSAGVFVVVCAAALTAALHHHTYIHHSDDASATDQVPRNTESDTSRGFDESAPT